MSLKEVLAVEAQCVPCYEEEGGIEEGEDNLYLFSFLFLFVLLDFIRECGAQ